MALTVYCTKSDCGKEIDQPGGLIFSPPPHGKFMADHVIKYHLCETCFDRFLDWMNGVEEVSTIEVLSEIPPALPTAFGNCHCPCHLMPGVNHVAPCCYNMPGDAAYDFYNKGI